MPSRKMRLLFSPTFFLFFLLTEVSDIILIVKWFCVRNSIYEILDTQVAGSNLTHSYLLSKNLNGMCTGTGTDTGRDLHVERERSGAQHPML